MLELDPNHAEARRSFELRNAALAREQAVERRRQEVESTYQQIDALLAQDDLDGGEWR